MFKPTYRLSDVILNGITDIERKTAQLSGTSIPGELLEHIRKQCRIALTHYSTQIEGNQLSIEQVSGVVDEHKSYGLMRDEKEVQNYFNLLEKMPHLLERYGKAITPKLVLACHKGMLAGIVTGNLRGKFREEQNAIYEAHSNRLVYLPPEAKDVSKLVDELSRWTRSTDSHPIIAAAIFHNQFVTIHPFIDGNGRVARFLTLYLLDAKGYEWRHLVPIDRYYADDRGTYYTTLQNGYPHNYYDGRNNTDFSKWIEYYVDGINKMLSGTLNQLELFRTESILMNNRQTRVLEQLKEKGFITASEYAQHFKISTRMAVRDLRQLVIWGKLTVIGKARATKYILA